MLCSALFYFLERGKSPRGFIPIIKREGFPEITGMSLRTYFKETKYE